MGPHVLSVGKVPALKVNTRPFKRALFGNYARSRNSDGFAEVQTLPTLVTSPEVVSRDIEQTVLERVLCADVQLATHCRCCAPLPPPSN